MTYYRQVFGHRKAIKKNKHYSTSVSHILREVTEANPSLGYRRVWTKAKARGYNKSKATAYLEMKRGGFLVPDPSYCEFKAAFEARKAYLVKPEGINELYQSDFT